MLLLLSLLLGIQVLSAWGVSPPEHPPPTPPRELLSPACNSSAVEAAADLALQEINADRREGYVLSLQRIFDVREQQARHHASFFYLTLDVLETECHVLSRQSYKNCSVRHHHETVYGQCKAILHVKEDRKASHLHSYDCVLRPIASADIVRVCPDCPVPGDPSAPKFLEAAAVSLAKFNAENNHIHYFAVLNVTKARSQWVVGPSNFVEYTIQETSCRKSSPVPDVSKCPLLPPETAEVGVCRGSVTSSQIENRDFVTAHCELYRPQPPVTEEEEHTPGKGEHHDEDEDHEDHHRHHRRRPHHRPHHRPDHRPHHHKPHHRLHGERYHEQEEHTFHCPPVGRVTVLPPSSIHVSLHSLPASEAEQLDGKPVPPEAQEAKPDASPSLPDIHGAHEEGSPLPDKRGRAQGPKCDRRGAPPFPAGFSQSDTCPGELIVQILGLSLPHKPVGLRDPKNP